MHIKEYGSEEGFEENFENFKNRFHKKDSPSAYRYYQTLMKINHYALFRSALTILKNADGKLYYDFLSISVPTYFIKGEKSWQEVGENMIEDFRNNGIG